MADLAKPQNSQASGTHTAAAAPGAVDPAAGAQLGLLPAQSDAERDALFFWDLRKSKVVGRYQFNELVSILSPTWAPDGKSVVFSGLSVSGYSDLYRLWLADPGDSAGAGRLERLTSDRYEDLDPSFSPDGRTVVFSSDRTAFGKSGAHNLFALDLPTGRVRYLTYGDWRDETPLEKERGTRRTGDLNKTFSETLGGPILRALRIPAVLLGSIVVALAFVVVLFLPEHPLRTSQRPPERS